MCRKWQNHSDCLYMQTNWTTELNDFEWVNCKIISTSTLTNITSEVSAVHFSISSPFFLLSAMLCLRFIGILFFCYVQRSVRLFFSMFVSVLAAVLVLRRCFQRRYQRPSRMSCQIKEILSSHFAHSIFSFYTH